jgi:hypothetical protein
VILAGHGTQDHARVAIQLLSGTVPQEVRYAHLGWRRHRGEWVYLHGGGAIGRNGPVGGVTVSLSPTFNLFKLPVPARGKKLRTALEAALRFLGVAPEPVTYLLFAAIWRAVLGDTDYSLFIAGLTGVGKTELVALVQQFWGGGLDARHLPTSWSSTANSNEALAFIAKDAILVVDDFAPGGGQYEVQKLNRDADRLLRGQGNSAGRGRMRSDSSLRQTKFPRGTLLSTGEDLPRGASLRARIIAAELTPEMVDWERMTACQEDARKGLYATALASFIQWLAAHYAERRRSRKAQLAKHRDAATSSQQHRRTPTIVANLFLGLDLFLEFAVDSKAMTAEEAEKFRDRGWQALGTTAAAQGALQAESDPVRRYLELLGAAIAAGKAHVADGRGEAPTQAKSWGWRREEVHRMNTIEDRWAPRGARIGWVEGDDLYVLPEAAFAVVQRMAQEGGEPIAIGCKTLSKRLCEQQHLVSSGQERQRLTVRKLLEGRQRNVLHLRSSALGEIAKADSQAPRRGPAGRRKAVLPEAQKDTAPEDD